MDRLIQPPVPRTTGVGAAPAAALAQDLRGTALFAEAERLHVTLLRPGRDSIIDAADPSVAPDGRHGVFTATVVDTLEQPKRTCLSEIDLQTGALTRLTYGPGSDRLPAYAPGGTQIAFVSDGAVSGEFQLELLDCAAGHRRAAPVIPGSVEYLRWSPDGGRILLGVVGRGGDRAGTEGAIARGSQPEDRPSWLPVLDSGDDIDRWRRLWVYDVVRDAVAPASGAHDNVWEADWCGEDAIAAIVSPGPQEGLWYSATLARIDLTGTSETIYRPIDQLGWVAGAPDGRRIAVVEAVCSDRWVVAGALRLIDLLTGEVQILETGGVDVTHVEWRSASRLLMAGVRGFETVVGVIDAPSGAFHELWCSTEISTAGYGVKVAGLGAGGDCLLVGEGFDRAPELATICAGRYRTLAPLHAANAIPEALLAGAEPLLWSAPDGLEIQGWLLRPAASSPWPVVLQVHGGPVSHWRPGWIGRRIASLMLLRRGIALFLPNPRGSSGRGKAFARAVVGDMGGADAADLLAGLDHLVASGLANSDRLGITGASYGGFMTAWLVTQDPRFAAAIPVAPMTHHLTHQLTSNIPHFVRLFVDGDPRDPAGPYVMRSPVYFADRVVTPTLTIAGARDRCTPPGEAVQFHAALAAAGAPSALLVYPEEGHGIRQLPAAIDYAARLVAWFEQHLGASPSQRPAAP